MGKNNGSNNMPGWVKRDLQLLKRVSVSLVEMAHEGRQDMAKTRRDMVELNQETRRDMFQLHAENEKMIAELRQQTSALKKTSDIHSKAILKLLGKS